MGSTPGSWFEIPPRSTRPSIPPVDFSGKSKALTWHRLATASHYIERVRAHIALTTSHRIRIRGAFQNGSVTDVLYPFYFYMSATFGGNRRFMVNERLE